MKKIPCRLIFHGSYKEIDIGTFESLAAAKKMGQYWERPYSIIKMTKP